MNERDMAGDVTREEFEAKLGGLADSVTRLEHVFEASMRQTNESITNLAEKIQRNSVTDWRGIWAGAAFGLGIMLAIGGILHQRITALDITLQREMRDLDAHGLEVTRGIQRQVDDNRDLMMIYVENDLAEVRELRARERRE